MADQYLLLQGLENLKNSFSLSDTSTAATDPNFDFILNQFYTNPIPIPIPNHHHHHQQQNPGFAFDNLFFPPPPLPENDDESPVKSEIFSGLFLHGDQDTINTPLPQQTISNYNNKRKAVETGTTTPRTANSSPQVSSDNGGFITRKNSTTKRGKKMKGNEKKDEIKTMEVVHVRAKRGQATDSHSLAERVRREKINERLKCLQDIVPGCYKTMGMAVMLDEIINYVQSLQNQVEFLSMKLTTASSFYDFNSEADALETMQRQKALETFKIQNGYSSADQFAPLDLTFGCFPQFPHHR
ncbi:hypothetical protein ABFS82_14G220700 [Erythranthe guttata]|uniref:BHLH domain-containing protein n=1 Tax=Erythranthe guttata TaxID=4155 RepID=A0A022R651_ERYGU|nr:PREDICTED: transcription factor BEE 1-like [Erythranthe guttata]EYU35927.1 hypothetical protein MIMGU_mgv1a022747mg [Erythranthe guttata]|eukprot:XP_012838134.1 PREDICTED: transcription factor BEE 1-like [Erythranthe guttata]